MGERKKKKRKSSSADTTPERVCKGKLLLCKLECEAVWQWLSSIGSSWGQWGCSYAILGQWRAQFFSRYIQTALCVSSVELNLSCPWEVVLVYSTLTFCCFGRYALH